MFLFEYNVRYLQNVINETNFEIKLNSKLNAKFISYLCVFSSFLREGLKYCRDNFDREE